ncbi:MAG: hypothetical protein ISS48_02995 [Candidatus Aenigmarchaeota archaeon]|nr:hypothetical protein [Candidatus Aenigmarchaeota archaeon]
MFYGNRILSYRNPNLSDEIQSDPCKTFVIRSFTPGTVDTGDGTATFRLGEHWVDRGLSDFDFMWEGRVRRGVDIFLQEAYQRAVEQATQRGLTVVEIVTDGFPQFSTYQPYTTESSRPVYGSIFADVIIRCIPQTERNIVSEV